MISLLLMLSVVSFTGWIDSQRFPEGVTQFQTMLRFSRAEAARKGRRLRLVFADEEQDRQFEILWEPEPLTEPNRFIAYSAGAWTRLAPNSLVRVTRCRLTGANAYRTLVLEKLEEQEDENALQPVTFYPDGSSDSAIIELAAMDEDDNQRAVVTLDGVSGIVTGRFVTEDELEELFSEEETISQAGSR